MKYLLTCLLATVFQFASLAKADTEGPNVPQQRELSMVLAANTQAWCSPSLMGGPGGYYDGSSSYRCIAGYIFSADEEWCPPGAGGKGGKFRPKHHHCEEGVVLSFEQSYCKPGKFGKGGAYTTDHASCREGYILGPGDDYCESGASGPGGSFKVKYQYCDAGKILALSLKPYRVVGHVSVLDEHGQLIDPESGFPLRPGSIIKTGPDGLVELDDAGNGRLTIDSDSEAMIRLMSQDSECDTKNCNLALELLLGGARWLTTQRMNVQSFLEKQGLIKPQPVTVVTEASTIGIRGTDYSIIVVPKSMAKQDTPAGLYVAVKSGAIFLKNSSGVFDLNAGQAAFVRTRSDKPVLLPKTPSFFEGKSIWQP